MTVTSFEASPLPPAAPSTGLEHKVIRDALSRLGNAQAEAVFAQARAERQLFETVSQLHFAGLSNREIATVTNISSAEVTHSLERLIRR